MPSEFAELDGHDAYDLLDVSPDATRQEIRHAYRALAKSNHPDLFTDPVAKAEAEENIRLLNAAREILDGRRAAYDAFRCAPDYEEPADAEIIDDPWATAEPGTPPTSDPWQEADYGQPPPAWTDQSSHYRRPMPPPQPGYAPMPPFRPVRVRSGRRGRIASKTSATLAIFWGIPALVAVVLIAGSSHKSPSGSGTRPSVPKTLAGTWEGPVKDAGAKKSHWDAKLTLRAGKRNGTVVYLGGKCRGTAVPVSYKAKKLTVKTEFPEGKSGCDVGKIHIAARSDDEIAVTYRDDKGSVNASGILTRQ